MLTWKTNRQAERQAIRLPSTETSSDATLSNDKIKHKARKEWRPDIRKLSFSGEASKKEVILTRNSSLSGTDMFSRKLSLGKSKRSQNIHMKEVETEKQDHNQNLLAINDGDEPCNSEYTR